MTIHTLRYLIWLSTIVKVNGWLSKYNTVGMYVIGRDKAYLCMCVCVVRIMIQFKGECEYKQLVVC